MNRIRILNPKCIFLYNKSENLNNPIPVFQVVTRNTFLLGLWLVGPAHLKSGLFYLQYRLTQGKRYCEIYSFIERSKLYGPDLNNRAGV